MRSRSGSLVRESAAGPPRSICVVARGQPQVGSMLDVDGYFYGWVTATVTVCHCDRTSRSLRPALSRSTYGQLCGPGPQGPPVSDHGADVCQMGAGGTAAGTSVSAHQRPESPTTRGIPVVGPVGLEPTTCGLKELRSAR
jgi:hypothetical protein